MVFNFQWTKSFWIRSWRQKLLDVGGGVKELNARGWSQSLKFALWLHSPGHK